MTDSHIIPSDRIISYAASGTISDYSFPFIVWEPTGIRVFFNDSLVDPATYAVTGLGNTTGGQVTFLEPPEAGTTVTIAGNTPRERAVDYNEYVTLKAAAMNLDANFQEAQIQENTRQLKRSLLTPPSDGITGGPLTLPTKDDRKNSYLAFDGDGNPIAMGDSANLVKGLRDQGSTPNAVMVWKDSSGLQADDSLRVFGEPNGAATLDSNGTVPDDQLPPRGHSISNDGMPVGYRKNLDFSDEFVVTDSDSSTNVRTAIYVTELGNGVTPVKQYGGHGELRVRTMVGGDNIAVRVGAKDQVEIFSDYVPKEYAHDFTLDTWNVDRQIVIPPAQHGLGNDDHLIVTIRDMAGNDVVANINVSGGGVVTISTDVTFPGTVMIYGGTAATVANMVNPMTAKGDIICAEDIGTPQRLPVGSPDQVLCVDQGSMPSYRSLGEAAWLGINIPGGVVQLNGDGEIPSELLPINSMTYKGTFGSPTSSTGGDLPTSGVLDGDIFIADSDYSSTVAGKSFSTGQWAIYNGSSWDIVPFADTSSGVPAGSVIAFAGNTVPQWFLPCNGYTLSKADYPYLFSAIGTLYNNGSETTDKFSIPNYNNERRFLQAATSAGTKTAPGLPEIFGTFGVDNNTGGFTTGAFWISRNMVSGASGYSGNNLEASFRASRYNNIYGASNTVQPPAQNVIYLIKYR